MSQRNCANHTINSAVPMSWKEQANYYKRSLAETAMYRLKNTLGEKLKNRTIENQMTEVTIKD